MWHRMRNEGMRAWLRNCCGPEQELLPWLTVSWTFPQKEDAADSCLEALILMQVPTGVRKKEELGGSPTFAAPVAFAGCSKLPCTARTALVLLRFWAPSKQRTPETSCGKNIWLKNSSLAVGSTGNKGYTMQLCPGLFITGRKFDIARWV